MLQHILAAIDFSPTSPQLQAQISRLPALGCKQVTLTYVIESGYTRPPQLGHQAHYESRLTELAQTLARATGLTVDSTVRTGSVAGELIAAAKSHGADTILAGTRSRGIVGELLLGNSVLELARVADRPLLLAPVDSAPVTSSKAVHRPLLATDGSPAAAGAEAAFLDILPRSGRGIVVSVGPWDEGENADQTRAHIEAHTRKLAGRAGAGNVIIELIDEGKPSQVIAQMAERFQVDLVIVGRRGRNRVRDLLAGSTAEAVCHQGRQLVLLVPASMGGV